ncbi:hypothetical protein [Aneurinibacillus aneurinilyticus]|jgi:hypothetical protein|uniref:Uncharacterized protein n=2 Tax=Aneurinibacillus aneurinilyticus TaxID=1391 RepID=A0A848CL36_ANEAE|nr:hypothetical protein [Aneurinibacillus aneurinilyticus]ERI09776.1 hypothetical protein HMPREF0083_02141 [Aneurinibacillus aneurinilyticus ATCC 12856]MCI1694958.1 hypothetical protein [Aneurinibacillus aneurinilyticus]MED0707131.1 hypothetical protein [Aneurinibacillus aneurinilyticus]MED0723481.1 hypothetical protein [Aneurinibacillus aneurinilyticus]MED0732800.1 hypothetical protein [Aneurinibacillus aneurinilyticus]
MRMYVCLSCLQVKQGDSHRVDMNICETCSSDFVPVNKDPQLFVSPPSLYVMDEALSKDDRCDKNENPSAFC